MLLFVDKNLCIIVFQHEVVMNKIVVGLNLSGIVLVSPRFIFLSFWLPHTSFFFFLRIRSCEKTSGLIECI